MTELTQRVTELRRSITQDMVFCRGFLYGAITGGIAGVFGAFIGLLFFR